MISVFYAYRSNINILHQTLSNYHRNQTVILYDNGFLPEDIVTPYQYFSDINKGNKNPLFYNEVPVPKFLEIVGDHKGAVIYDGSKIRGKIKYTDYSNTRIVRAVEWLNDKEEIINIDYYNQYGVKFAEEIYDEAKKVLVRHFNRDGQEVIYQNYITNDVILTWKNKIYHFDTYSKFIKFFLMKFNVNKENFLTSDFSFVFSILNQLPNEYHKVIVLQEKLRNKYPKEINTLFINANEKNFSLLIPDMNDYIELKQKFSSHCNEIYRFGYYYPFIENPRLKGEVLILTASEMIYNIDYIISNCKNITFNIAALSEMSDKLLELKKYKNVNLFPVVKKKTLKNLVRKSSIYLDINAGSEVNNVIENVFLNNLLIFGFKNTVHNPERVADQFIFEYLNYTEFTQRLKYYYSDEDEYLQGLNIQKEYASAMEITQIIEILNYINNNEKVSQK